MTVLCLTVLSAFTNLYLCCTTSSNMQDKNTTEELTYMSARDGVITH